MIEPLILHASCVAWQGRGVLITGASGRGKSSLALRLMAYGAELVSDDRTELRALNGLLEARCPEPLKHLIEARGMGLLRAQARESATVVCRVDLDHTEIERMPEQKTCEILGVETPLFHNCVTLPFAEAVLQYLKTAKAD